ncbi:unnamed protein product [Cylicocyclus nassatus]|uniref:Uncharacterized protein n=1 Tax=Cylicocyclus nassatus TaxID=53992 RepID=A0AA36HCA5_CYLNA|nr:unnamed protein product [Cylicocyclus nassatus]
MSDNKDHHELKQKLQQLTEALYAFCDAINTLRNAREGTLNNLSKSTSGKSDNQDMQRHERSLERRDSEKTETHSPGKRLRQSSEGEEKDCTPKRCYQQSESGESEYDARGRREAFEETETSSETSAHPEGPEQPILQVRPEDMIQHVSQEEQLVVEVIEVFNEVNETRELHDEEEERFVEIIEEDDEQDTGIKPPKREKGTQLKRESLLVKP